MSRETPSISGTFDCRIAFADELAALARCNPRVVAVCNDSVVPAIWAPFARSFPRE